MAAKRPLTVACLVPEGRATRHADVAFAHANGTYLAGQGAILLGDGARGEIADAMVSGAKKAGGTFRVVVADGAPQPSYPAAVDVIELEPGQVPCAWIGIEADAIWALPPRVGDLERYFDTWRGAEDKPVVCVAPGNEFRLLQGIVDDVISVGRSGDAQQVIFAASPAEGFELLEDRIGSRSKAPATDAG